MASVPAWTHSVNHQQKRSFLEGLFGTDKPPKSLEGAKATPKNLDIAIGKLVDLLRARRSRSRTPQHDELLDAFRFLFNARNGSNQPLTRNEVFLVTETYKHLEERDLILSEHPGSITNSDLLIILETLALPTPNERFRSDTRALAEIVCNSLNRGAGPVS